MRLEYTGPRSASNANEFEGFYVQYSTLLKEKRGLSLISARLRSKKKLLLQPHPTDQVVLSRYRVTDILGGLFMGEVGKSAVLADRTLLSSIPEYFRVRGRDGMDATLLRYWWIHPTVAVDKRVQ